MKKYIIILSIFFFFSCDMWDDRLVVINKTNRSLIVRNRIWVSDTSIYAENKKDIDNFYFHKGQIFANEFKKFTTNGNWELCFENDTLVFLVLIQKLFSKNASKNQRITMI